MASNLGKSGARLVEPDYLTTPAEEKAPRIRALQRMAFIRILVMTSSVSCRLPEERHVR
jgi:hypothetical protein